MYCSGKGEHGHEPLTRKRGGSTTDPNNVMDVCFACHRWIHDHDREATLMGLLISSEDAMNLKDDVETMQPAGEVTRARQAERAKAMADEYPAAELLAKRYGLKLMSQAQLEPRYYLDLDACDPDAPELVLWARTGRPDLTRLPDAESAAIVERAGPFRRFGSLVAFVEAVIAVRRLRPLIEPTA